jgi:hypothetical protein
MWEYKVFTGYLYDAEILIDAVYPECPLPYEMRVFVDAGVNILLYRLDAQGWEPAEPTDSESLWKAGQITYKVLKVNRNVPLGPLTDSPIGDRMWVHLESVAVYCRRLTDR